MSVALSASSSSSVSNDPKGNCAWWLAGHASHSIVLPELTLIQYPCDCAITPDGFMPASTRAASREAAEMIVDIVVTKSPSNGSCGIRGLCGQLWRRLHFLLDRYLCRSAFSTPPSSSYLNSCSCSCLFVLSSLKAPSRIFLRFLLHRCQREFLFVTSPSHKTKKQSQAIPTIYQICLLFGRLISPWRTTSDSHAWLYSQTSRAICALATSLSQSSSSSSTSPSASRVSSSSLYSESASSSSPPCASQISVPDLDNLQLLCVLLTHIGREYEVTACKAGVSPKQVWISISLFLRAVLYHHFWASSFCLGVCCLCVFSRSFHRTCAWLLIFSQLSLAINASPVIFSVLLKISLSYEIKSGLQNMIRCAHDSGLSILSLCKCVRFLMRSIEIGLRDRWSSDGQLSATNMWRI